MGNENAFLKADARSQTAVSIGPSAQYLSHFSSYLPCMFKRINAVHVRMMYCTKCCKINPVRFVWLKSPQCAGKSECSRCSSANGRFCRACLLIRYGWKLEDVREQMAQGIWLCPHCYEEDHPEEVGLLVHSIYAVYKRVVLSRTPHLPEERLS